MHAIAKYDRDIKTVDEDMIIFLKLYFRYFPWNRVLQNKSELDKVLQYQLHQHQQSKIKEQFII